jgi:hypothetical protein
MKPHIYKPKPSRVDKAVPIHWDNIPICDICLKFPGEKGEMHIWNLEEFRDQVLSEAAETIREAHSWLKEQVTPLCHGHSAADLIDPDKKV